MAKLNTKEQAQLNQLLTKMMETPAEVAKKGTVTIWKLGDLEHRILPGPTAVKRLEDTIKKLKLPGNHIVWGPDLNVETVTVSD